MKSIIIATVIAPFITGTYNGWKDSEREMIYQANEMKYERWVQRVEFASGLRDALRLPEDSLVVLPAPNYT
jgi:hypothetical protein